MKVTSNKEWFLWKKHSNVRHPWERQRNTDFLKSEKKRIDEVTKWWGGFLVTDYGHKLCEITYYTVPIKIKSYWLNFSGSENYTCKGLSALRNHPIKSLIAFFPSNNTPPDYTPIRIISSRKHAILSGYTKSTIGEYSIIVNEWEKLPNDYLYKDVPFEPKIIPELFETTLGAEKMLANALQLPLIGAPYVLNDVGGISLASLLDDSGFALDISKAMQLMMPPEYRSIPPPASALKGKNIQIANGIKIHVAEKIFTDKNYFSSVYGSNYSVMENELRRRREFQGEYSISGMLISSSRGIQLTKDIMHRFFDPEISVANMRKMIDADADTRHLVKKVDENLWLQIVYMKQFYPAVIISPQEEKRFKERIKEDIDVVFSEKKIPEIYLEHLVEMNVDKCIENLKRIAKAHARTGEKNTATFDDLEWGRSILLDRLWELNNDPTFKNLEYTTEVEMGNIRAHNVENILRSLGRATPEEIYLRVDKNFFKDIEDLKGLLRWFDTRSPPKVYKDGKGRYGWV